MKMSDFARHILPPVIAQPTKYVGSTFIGKLLKLCRSLETFSRKGDTFCICFLPARLEVPFSQQRGRQ